MTTRKTLPQRAPFLVTTGHSRSKNGVASLAYDPVVHADVRRIEATRRISASQHPAWIAGSSRAMTKYEIVLATHSAPELCPPPRRHSKKNSPPANKGRRSAERRNPTIGRAASTGVAADRCPGAAARHNGGAPAFRRFTAALARPNASSLGSAPEPGFPTSRARGCFARLHPSVG